VHQPQLRPLPEQGPAQPLPQLRALDAVGADGLPLPDGPVPLTVQIERDDRAIGAGLCADRLLLQG
jgi:hypothetical protein